MCEKKDEFTITLTNTVIQSENLSISDNKILNNSDIHTILHKPIILNDNSWEVGLVDILLPANTLTIDNSNNIFYMVVRNPKMSTLINRKLVWEEVLTGIDYADRKQFHDYRNIISDDNNQDNEKDFKYTPKLIRKHLSTECTSYSIPISKGVYKSVTDLLAEINNGIFKYNSKTNVMKANLKSMNYRNWITGVYLTLRLNENGYCQIISNSDECIGFAFSRSLATMLGVESRDYEYSINGKMQSIIFARNSVDAFEFKPNFQVKLSNLYIYSDIIEHRLMGGIQTPFLRHLSFNPLYSTNTNDLERIYKHSLCKSIVPCNKRNKNIYKR